MLSSTGFLLQFENCLFRPTQEGRTDPRIKEIGDQRAEANVGEEMVGHVDAVVSVDQHKHAGDDKGGRVLACAALFA